MFGALGGLLGGAVSAIGSLFGAKSQNDANKEMVAQQEAYQTQMSNTAYQRASADMTAAGLNPMMMFGSGSAASTPSGAIAPQISGGAGAGAAMGGAIEKAIPTAVALKTADATIENLVAQNAKIKAETITEGTKPGLITEETGLTKSRAAVSDVERGIKAQDLDVAIASAARARLDKQYYDSRLGEFLYLGGKGGQDTAHVISPVTNVISSAKGAKNLLNIPTFSERYGGY